MKIDSGGINIQTLFLSSLIVLVALGLGLLIGFLFTKSRYLRVKAGTAGNINSKPNRQHTRAIYNLVVALSASLNYERILEYVLDLSSNILATDQSPPDKLVSAVLMFSHTEGQATSLLVASARRFTPADTRIVLPGNKGILRHILDDPQPVLIRNVAQDPELGRTVAMRACQSLYALPLRSGLDTYGILLFAHPDPNYFSEEKQEILDIVSRQASIAIQNAKLYSDLEEEKFRMIDIQEEARKKLARDLHDGPTQSVSALAMRVNYARRLLDRDLEAGKDELYKIEDLARRTTQEIRHMLFTLRPLVLESQGLLAAMEAMAEKMRETYNQSVVICVDPNLASELELNKQAVLFNIAEEAVNNARKHAEAPTIWVRLDSVDEGLGLLEIEDNGNGFDLAEIDAFYEKRGSLGLVNMRERAELVNGILTIDSSQGKGTRIRLVFPFTEEAADRLRNGG